MKDVTKGVLTVLFLMAGFVAVGWLLGKLASDYVNTLHTETHPVWYCIDGKLYERFGDVYATVVPARGCLPISTD